MTQPNRAEKISITLPSDMLKAIKEKIQSGAYNSTSEVIREAVRRWQRDELEYEAHIALIRQRLENAKNSGEPVPLEDAFSQIEMLHQQQLAERNDENL